MEPGWLHTGTCGGQAAQRLRAPIIHHPPHHHHPGRPSPSGQADIRLDGPGAQSFRIGPGTWAGRWRAHHRVGGVGTTEGFPGFAALHLRTARRCSLKASGSTLAAHGPLCCPQPAAAVDHAACTADALAPCRPTGCWLAGAGLVGRAGPATPPQRCLASAPPTPPSSSMQIWPQTSPLPTPRPGDLVVDLARSDPPPSSCHPSRQCGPPRA